LISGYQGPHNVEISGELMNRELRNARTEAREMKEQIKAANGSESDLIALLSEGDLLKKYHRYRRAIKPHPHAMLNDEELKMYDEDRVYMNKVYQENRKHGFSYANEFAHEKLFLKCFDR
jgi:hypothetical protein